MSTASKMQFCVPQRKSCLSVKGSYDFPSTLLSSFYMLIAFQSRQSVLLEFFSSLNGTQSQKNLCINCWDECQEHYVILESGSTWCLILVRRMDRGGNGENYQSRFMRYCSRGEKRRLRRKLDDSEECATSRGWRRVGLDAMQHSNDDRDKDFLLHYRRSSLNSSQFFHPLIL